MRLRLPFSACSTRRIRNYGHYMRACKKSLLNSRVDILIYCYCFCFCKLFTLLFHAVTLSNHIRLCMPMLCFSLFLFVFLFMFFLWFVFSFFFFFFFFAMLFLLASSCAVHFVIFISITIRSFALSDGFKGYSYPLSLPDALPCYCIYNIFLCFRLDISHARILQTYR